MPVPDGVGLSTRLALIPFSARTMALSLIVRLVVAPVASDDPT